jgi:Kef-type K+ transport system membrane component KefB
MSSAEFGSFSVLLLVLLSAAHLLGDLFNRLRQPRVAGEILAGVILGPSVLGHIAPAVTATMLGAGSVPEALGLKYQAIVGFLYNLGLLLLMFASGAEAQGLFRREDRREVGWLGVVGTGLPFVAAIAAAPLLPLETVIGPANHRVALLLVIGIAVAVTSIPVIARIFHDLQILHTRFARLVLGVAVIEDILLWGVLAVAAALAASTTLPAVSVARHTAAALVFFGLGLTVVPWMMREMTRAPWNVFARNAPVAYLVAVLFAYTAIAAAVEVNLAFAAFLAGYALVRDQDLNEARATLNRVSFAVFIPIYFAVVGYQLDVARTFSSGMVAFVLLAACLVKLVSAGLGARLAGFPWRDSVNLSIVLNARGGPGIVLASVAYDARIINGEFYTTLVILAVLTSQAAGAWLDYVLRRGWPLLTERGSPAGAGWSALEGRQHAMTRARVTQTERVVIEERL